MYCQECGAEVKDNAVVCVKCGCATGVSLYSKSDKKSIGFAFLSFFFPTIGFILWLVWRELLPKRARSCGKGALVGLLVGILLVVLVTVGLIILINNLDIDSAKTFTNLFQL